MLEEDDEEEGDEEFFGRRTDRIIGLVIIVTKTRLAAEVSFNKPRDLSIFLKSKSPDIDLTVDGCQSYQTMGDGRAILLDLLCRLCGR